MASRDLRSLTPISSAGELNDAAIVFGALSAGADEPSTYELGALRDFINADRVKAPSESTTGAIPRYVDTTGKEIGASDAHVDADGNITSPGAIASQTRKLDVHDDIKLQASVPDAPAAGYVRLFAREVGGVTRIGIIDENEAVTELTGLLGDVFGPGSAVTDGHAAVFDGVTGKLLKSAGAAPSLVGHNHDSSYYTKTQIDTALSGKSDTSHDHNSIYYTKTLLDAGQLDGRYYTEAEVDSLLSGKQAALAYAPEDVANKDTDTTLAANSDTKYPSQKAIRAYVDARINDLINAAPGTLDTLGEIAAALEDADDTVAALTATVVGKLAKSSNLSDLTNAATARANLGVAINADVQAYSANLTTFAGIAPSANAQSLLGAANYAAMRALLDLEAGTDFYSVAAADAAFVPVARAATAGSGLTGGGDLSGDISFSMSANQRTGSIVVTIGDGSNAITTSPAVKGYLPISFAGTLTGWAIVADASGSAVVDVWKAAGSVPTNSDSIAGSEKPTLSAAQLASDASLTTWTTSFAAGDIFGFEVESASTVKQITITLSFTKT